ncbi:oxygenase MpaB family protein [Nocardioides sp. NPDC058538]|uniref:oxygenase MpaB family protein n=1 Tax=Nocardioides sp. NPDC058538 TaxID=3346542 RepID=UPI003665CB67
MPGYFAADSMVVRAIRQRVVGLSWGQRALVIGGLHPRLFVGTAQHTVHRATPYTRLALTARLMEAVFLGTEEEADRALAFHGEAARARRGDDGGPRRPRASRGVALLGRRPRADVVDGGVRARLRSEVRPA